MRNFLAFLAVVALALAAGGYYCGWYTVQAVPAEQGRTAFHVEVDRTKIGNDLVDAAREVRRALSKDPAEEKDQPAENARAARPPLP
jgi:hypothetical protein